MFAVLLGGVTEYLYSAKKNTFIIVGLTTAFISIAGMLNWFPAMVSRLANNWPYPKRLPFYIRGKCFLLLKRFRACPKSK